MENVIQMLKELSNDAAVNNSMVCQLWSDGEITLQKGGDLFGLRSLHSIHDAVLAQSSMTHELIRLEMPHQSSKGFGFGFLFCESTEEALKVRKAMIELIK